MRTPFAQARKRLLEAELARRAPKAESQSFDPRRHARPGHQTAFARDRARFREACTGRRSGKSTTVVDDALAESWAQPNGSVLYLNTTARRARKTVWHELKEAVRREGMPYVAYEGSMRGPENRWIFISGGETEKHIDKWKGVLPPLVAAYIDEGQDWDEELLEYTIARVILPALADRGGRLTVTGTPAPIPDGFYFDLTQNPEWSHHAWTMFDIHDPAAGVMVGAHELLAEALRIRGVDISDPTIQREFYGRWVRDTSILVFGALDDQLNAYDPPPPEGDWTFVGGVDFGYVDSSAINVLGWARDADPHMYVLRNEERDKMGASATIEWVKGVFNPLGVRLAASAGDPAAGGKNIMADLWERHGLQIEPATKEDKVGGCKLMAAAIADRSLLLPRAHPLFRALRRVQWDPDYRGEKLRGHTPDRVDALLYAFRAAWPLYDYRPRPEVPSPEEEHIQKILRRQEEAEGDPG